MRTLALLAVAVLALAGCGGADPSPEDQVRQAIADYRAAVGGDGDPERVCDLIVTPAGRVPGDRCRSRITRSGRAIRAELPGEVRSVEVQGGAARVIVAGGERVRLRRVDGDWRIVVPD